MTTTTYNIILTLDAELNPGVLKHILTDKSTLPIKNMTVAQRKPRKARQSGLRSAYAEITTEMQPVKPLLARHNITYGTFSQFGRHPKLVPDGYAYRTATVHNEKQVWMERT